MITRSPGRCAAALLVPVLLLSACDGQRRGADGYTFGGAEWERPSGRIEFVLHPSFASLRAAAPASARREGEQLMAWSAISEDPARPCRVHIVDPRLAYRPEWIGHEVTHCLHGRWHEVQSHG